MEDWRLFAQKGYPLKIAINVPASVIGTPGFVEEVRKAIPHDQNFPGLLIEITEDEIIANLRARRSRGPIEALSHNHFNRRFWNGIRILVAREGFAI